MASMRDKMKAMERESLDMKKELELLRAEAAQHRSSNHQQQQQQQQTQQVKARPYYEVRCSDGIYFGELNDEGHKHGRGLFKAIDGSLYYGEWKHNKICGKGVMISEAGIYEGEWLDRCKHGRGVSHWMVTHVLKRIGAGKVGLLVYDGEWRDGKSCGKGLSVGTDEGTYEGEWENDVRTGLGEIRWSYGDRYRGMWKNDDKSGYGTYWFSNGDRYQGDWVDSRQHGIGVYHFSGLESQPREVYRGEWRDGLIAGKGVLKYKDGSTYEGHFVNELFDGPRGCFTSVKHGYTFEGEFSKGLRKKGKIRWSNGDSWEGNYLEAEAEDNREDGGEETSEGEMRIAETGNIVKGRWRDYSMKNGKGEMVMWMRDENREVKGEWIKGQFHNKATTLDRSTAE